MSRVAEPDSMQLSLFSEPTSPLSRSALPPAQTIDPASPPVAQPSAAAAPLAPAIFRHPRAQREIRLGEHLIGYELRRARRRSIGFTIGGEGLTVSAPRWVGIQDIESALRGKAAWILRKLADCAERSRRLDASRIEWRDGATLPFLGETVIVVLDPRATGAVLNVATDTLPGVARLTLHLALPASAQPEQIRDAVQSWLQRQARRIFDERCSLYAERLKVRMTRLSLSSAATRWGSASADGSIRLNWRLIHFGLPVIDYVVAHELAHLREMNHSPRFWDVVRSVFPGYEAAREVLRDPALPVL
jgi:hypothetical protein